MPSPKDLQQSGLKVTMPRMKILEVFENHRDAHLTADDVYRILVTEGLDIGLATVYRALTQFEQAGILERQAQELQEAYAPWAALSVADSEDGWILMTARKA